MAWKPKTIAGKILKGAVVAGGSVLGLAAGTQILGKVGGVIKTAVNTVRDRKLAKGTTALTQPATLLGIKPKIDLVKENAINLVTGTTQEARDYIKNIKERTRTEAEKLKALNKAVLAGATPAEARAALGLEPEAVETYEGQPVVSAGFGDFLQNKNVLYVLGGLALLFILLKRR